MNQQNLSSFIWFVANLLHGDYQQSDYDGQRGCPTLHNNDTKQATKMDNGRGKQCVS
jgi:hypothetical protein